MLNTNNPFVFASSSAVDPLAPQDALSSPPGMPESFVWAHLLVTLAEVAPSLPAEAPPVPPVPTEPLVVSIEALAAVVPVKIVVAPITPAVPLVVVAPAPALVTIAEPAPLPAPIALIIPAAMPADPAFDAYARLFQRIEDRDLLADLQATLVTGSDWANAFGPPLG